MSSEKGRLRRWLGRGVFCLALCGLLFALGWQVRDLLSYIRPHRSEEYYEPKEMRINQHAALMPGDIFFPGEEGAFYQSQPFQGEYSFLRFLGQEMLQQALYSEEGRSVTADSIAGDPNCFFYIYSCPLPAEFFEELGASDLLMSGFPSQGINEIRFYPASYYWQDSVVVLCSREADFWWKFVIYGKNRSSAEQENLDYYADLLEAPHPVYEAYIRDPSGLMVPSDENFPGNHSFEAVPYFRSAEGTVNETAAGLYANRVFSYADTISAWSFSPDATIFTNEYATLRVQSDGNVFYSGPGLHDRSELMLAAYEAAYEFIERPSNLAYNSGVSIRPVAYLSSGNIFTFTFAYYYKGMRIEGLAPMKVNVRNTDVISFTGSVYRFGAVAPAEKEYYSWEQWLALYEEINSGKAPTLSWICYEDEWFPALMGGDEPLLPFELPEEEPAEEESPKEESSEEGEAEPDVSEEAPSGEVQP